MPESELDPLLDRLLGPELGHVLRPWPGMLSATVRTLAREAGMTELDWLTRQSVKPEKGATARLISAATVGHTSFFRHPEQFDYLRAGTLGRIARARGRAVRIWSVGCATGEEPYSLAMLAADCRVPVDILATDVNEESLRIARAGWYRPRSASGLPGCDPVHGWTAPEALRRMVRFERASVVGPVPSRGEGRFDLIFCRNVLIYFETSVAVRIVEDLMRRLDRDGALIVSPTEGVLRAEWSHGAGTPLGWFVPKRAVRRSSVMAMPAVGGEAPQNPPPSPAPGLGMMGGTSSSAAATLEIATRRLSSGDAEGAEEALRALLDRDPEHAEGWFLLGEVLFSRGERVQAKSAFLRATRGRHHEDSTIDEATLQKAALRRAEACG